MAKRKNKIYLLTMILLCLLGVIFASYKLLYWTSSDVENSNIKKEIEEEIIVEESNETNETTYEIDFKELKKKNKDAVAYLKVNNTKIDYVVVKAKDNDYYLHHNFKKQSNVAGWVFADYHNKYDGNDRNLVIYGHNMRNGSMFGTLKKILKKDWYKNTGNHIVTLVTEDGLHKYQVFSVYSIPVESYYINTQFNNNKDFYKFLKKINSRSIYNFKVDLKETDKILTLSTCTANSTKRVVLHAKLIDND